MKRRLPSITIGICVHNEKDNISRALESCLNSNYPRKKMEIVVVDDGSDDGTVDIIEKFVEKNKIKLYKIPRSGKSTAVNKVLEKAKGDKIVFLSGDCVVRENSIRLLVQNFNENIGGTTGRKIVTNKKPPHIFSEILWKIHHKLSLLNPKMCGDLCAIKSDILNKIPSDTINDDRHIGAAIEKEGFSVKYVPKAIVEVLPYESIGKYFRWRRRIIRGHIQSIDLGMSTGFGFLNTLKVVFEEMAEKPKCFPFYMISITLDILASLAAHLDKISGNVPYVWER